MLIWSTPGALFAAGGVDFTNQFRRLADVRHQLGQHFAGAFGGGDPALGQLADFRGGRGAALGEFAHFAGDHGEAFAVFSGAGGFHGGVERQQVRLARDLLDDVDLLRDFLHRGDGLG